MSRASGRDFIVRLRFYGMNKVRKLDRILYEKDRHIVAYQIEVAFVGEKLDRKTANVTHRIPGAPRALHGGETHKHRGLLARILQKARLGQGAVGLVRLKIAMRPGASRVHDALGNPLVVKMRDFLAHDEVFEQRRTAGAGLEGVLIISNLHPLVGS